MQETPLRVLQGRFLGSSLGLLRVALFWHWAKSIGILVTLKVALVDTRRRGVFGRLGLLGCRPACRRE